MNADFGSDAICGTDDRLTGSSANAPSLSDTTFPVGDGS